MTSVKKSKLRIAHTFIYLTVQLVANIKLVMRNLRSLKYGISLSNASCDGARIAYFGIVTWWD
jgi:hypothetical protein